MTKTKRPCYSGEPHDRSKSQSMEEKISNRAALFIAAPLPIDVASNHFVAAKIHLLQGHSCSSPSSQPSQSRIQSLDLVDLRRRLEPPTSAMYFGNCVLPSCVEMKVGKLVEEEDGLTLACKAIGNKIKELESGGIGSILKDLGKHPAHVRAGNPIYVIGYFNKFGVYGVDFGWGSPVKVESFVDDDEGFTMAGNGDDGKSVEIGVVLPKHEIEEFVTIFRTSLTALSQNKP